jgi:transcriptional regulator with XRE-family HTH domain
MRQRGLTGAELARRAAVSAATISHAVNGRRIHPAKLRAILDAMHRAEPLPGLDLLILRDDGPSGPRVSTMTMPNRGLPSPTRRRRSPD